MKDRRGETTETELGVAKLSVAKGSRTLEDPVRQAITPQFLYTWLLCQHRGSTGGDQIKQRRINSASTRNSSVSARLNPPKQMTQAKVPICASCRRTSSFVLAAETGVSSAPPVGPEEEPSEWQKLYIRFPHFSTDLCVSLFYIVQFRPLYILILHKNSSFDYSSV